MRTWRVGTISMGLTLVLLGIFLVLSQIFNWDLAYVMMSWWPIILIVLGVEVLIYLFLARKENPIVKYDLLSIFLVGIIGVVGIGLATISATGILDKVDEWMNSEVKEVNLPTYSEHLDDSIQRIVVQTGLDPLSIETGKTDEIAIFGTYTAEVGREEVPIEESEDYLFTEHKGDTLFVTFKKQPHTFRPIDHHGDRKATMIIPDHVQVEIDANHQSLYVHSRTLLNEWTIMNAMDVQVMLANDLDVMLNAKNIGHIENEDNYWKLASKGDDEIAGKHSGTFKLGEGTYMMNILNTSNVSVMKNE